MSRQKGGEEDSMVTDKFQLVFLQYNFTARIADFELNMWPFLQCACVHYRVCVVEGESGMLGGDTHQMVDDKLVLNYLLHLCAKDFCLSSFLIDWKGVATDSS